MDSNSKAFYLKYRPQTILEVGGQERVKQSIAAAFKSNRLSHAYLFVGPRGTGKTSMARILAKMVNCERKDVPCNECSTCISITDGSNLDLIEIDAASNRGIEDIRALREKIKLAPTSTKKKVYIIDEVHMLTQEAFNALLKTLEEPPSHALFILATTDVTKVPSTIISRCTRLDFSLAPPKDLKEALDRIIKAEKINIEEDALMFLIKKADGSFRDGVKLLDQVATFGGKITKEVLEKSLKSSNFEEILSLVETLAKKDTKSSLALILKQVEGGGDIKDLILSLQDILRNLVFIKNGLGQQLVEPNLMEENYQQLVNISQSFSNQDLVKDLDILQKALEQLKFASILSLPLELAVVEMTQSVILSNPELLESERPRSRRLVEGESKDLSQMRDSSLVAQSDKEQIATVAPEGGSLTSSDSSDITKLKEKWTFVLETIRPYNFSLEAMLRSVRISSITDSTVVMEVPYSFHQRILEAPKNRDILEGILSDILGRKIRISCILGSKPIQRGDIANIEVAQDDEIIRIASEIFNSDSVN